MSVQSDLENAIIERRVVQFMYDGLLREVEPFLLGTTTAGRPALRGYQTEGGSKSGKVPDWHLFSLCKIYAVTILPKHFSGERPFYNPFDKAMRSIGVHV